MSLYTEVKSIFEQIESTKYYTNFNDPMFKNYGGANNYADKSDNLEIDKLMIEGNLELIGTFFNKDVDINNQENPCIKLFLENDFFIEEMSSIGYDNSDTDSCYSIYKFEKFGKKCYVKFNGWFSSYMGGEFSKYFEVTPTEKTIIVYDQV